MKWTRRVDWRLALLALLLLPRGASAAGVFLGMADSAGPGDFLPASVLVSTQGPEGPGEVQVTLQWGADFGSSTQFGAVQLHALPTAGALGPLSIGADCSAGIGEYAGTCTMTVQVDQPIDGTASIADLTFIYEWVPAPGYEVCTFVEPDPTCTPAHDRTVVSSTATAFGDASEYGVETGTFVSFGTRPIAVVPEVPFSAPIPRALLVLVLAACGVGLRLRRPVEG